MHCAEATQDRTQGLPPRPLLGGFFRAASELGKRAIWWDLKGDRRCPLGFEHLPTLVLGGRELGMICVGVGPATLHEQ